MMRLPPGTPKSQDAALEQLWRQVCASRGTPAPDPAGLARFMEDLETHVREKLQSVLLLAARGREAPGELSLLSWAASCTRPALLERLATHGLAFTGAHLFACGLRLREQGWDMQHRIAQLAGNPADVDTLRALLPVKTVALAASGSASGRWRAKRVGSTGRDPGGIGVSGNSSIPSTGLLFPPSTGLSGGPSSRSYSGQEKQTSPALSSAGQSGAASCCGGA